MSEGDAVFVEAGADHRFTGYESLAVLVIFTRRGLSRRVSGSLEQPVRERVAHELRAGGEVRASA